MTGVFASLTDKKPDVRLKTTEVAAASIQPGEDPCGTMARSNCVCADVHRSSEGDPTSQCARLYEAPRRAGCTIALLADLVEEFASRMQNGGG